ncbi:hypothetical protein V2J09_008587 [Rumex salicifolius]
MAIFSSRNSLLNCVLVVMLLGESRAVVKAANVPAMFVFGDSLVDAGNNNFLNSIAKANYWPYGFDFNGGTTGRFCNGNTVADLLGELLGLPYLPVFADPATTGTKILRGVNYASAAGGILDDTGRHWGDRYSLTAQVTNFEKTLDQLRALLTSTGINLTQYLAKSIVLMSFGSNDYINNYLMPALYTSSATYTPQQFGNLLLNRYTRQILALHSLGLRKFFLAGLGPLGCIPYERATGGPQPGRCVDSINQMLGTFNDGLRTLVDQLNRNHPGAIFVYANAYRAVGDVLNNPASYGFRVIDRGCCGVQSVTRQGQIMTCLRYQVPCSNRSEFVFWDAYHTSEAANTLLARRAFSGPPDDCYPINLQQLAAI